MKRAFLGIVLALLPSTASADDTEVAHEGLYVRVTGGFAGSLTTLQKADGSGSTITHGTGGAFQLMIGGTPTEGLAVGVLGAMPHGGGVKASGVGAGSLSLSLLGLFGDYYPDATGSVHFGGAVGYGIANYAGGDGVSRGVGGLAFAGYDLWFGDNWSLALMLQLHGQLGWGNDKPFGDSQSYKLSGVNLVAGGSLQVGILFN